MFVPFHHVHGVVRSVLLIAGILIVPVYGEQASAARGTDGSGGVVSDPSALIRLRCAMSLAGHTDILTGSMYAPDQSCDLVAENAPSEACAKPSSQNEASLAGSSERDGVTCTADASAIATDALPVAGGGPSLR